MSLGRLRRNGIYSVKKHSSLERKKTTSMELVLIGLGTYLNALIFNKVVAAASCLGAVITILIVERFKK